MVEVPEGGTSLLRTEGVEAARMASARMETLVALPADPMPEAVPVRTAPQAAVVVARRPW